MKKTVEEAIYRINRRVKRETAPDVEFLDFLFDAHDVYEYDEDGREATCDYIIRGLEHEADIFVEFWRNENEV